MASTILIVDDSAELRELTREILLGERYVVLEAGTGAEALARAAEGPDLVVLDVALPDLDGFEVCRRLRRDRRTAHIPVLLLSGVRREVEDRIRGLETGAEAYLVRPLESAELIATVRALLRGSRSGRSSGASAKRPRAADVLADVNRTITQSLDREEVARRIVESLRDLLGVRTAGLFEMIPESGALVLVARAGDLGPGFPPRVVFPAGTGLMGVALREGRPVHTANVLADPRVELTADLRRAVEQAPYRAGVAFPLLVKDRVIGGLFVADAEDWALDETDFRLAAAFADQAAVALENARLYSETERRREEAEERLRESETLLAVGRTLSDDISAEEAMRRVAREVAKALSADMVGAYFLDADRGLLRPLAGYRVPRKWLQRFRDTPFPVGDSAAWRDVWRTRRPVWTPDGMRDPRWATRELLPDFPRHSALFVPTPVRGEIVGGLFVIRWGAGPEPSSGELRLVEGIAAQVGLALERREAEFTRTRLETELRHAQKMDAIGRLASGVAHDFNNVLTVILGRSEILRGALTPENKLYRHADLIQKSAERASTLTQQLLALSRKQVLEPRVLDVGALLGGLNRMLRRLIGEHIDLAVSVPAALGRIKADPGQIQQVILNLVVNARDAMPDGGRLAMEAAGVELDDALAREHPGTRPGRYVMLAVADNGVGMDEAIRAHLFEPFFSTKGPGKGTGLGLATVYGIVKQSGGFITYESQPGKGTTFRVYLPQVDEPVDAVEYEAEPPGPSHGSETILLVEDDEFLRATAREMLELYGYRIVDARHPGEALLVAERRAEPLDLLLTDVVMPQMSGPELAGRVVELRPRIKTLFMSGYADDPTFQEAGLPPGVTLLRKPFSANALAQKVREVLDTP
jgi:signal transduction histidine kinase/DNA-binding response OmpR family regulator